MAFNSYSETIAKTPDDLANIIESVASGKVNFCRILKVNSEFRFRFIDANSISLFRLVSTFSSEFSFDPVDYHRFVFQTQGAFDAKVDGWATTGKAGTSYYIGPGQHLWEHHPEGYKSIAMRVEKSALEAKARTFFDYGGNTEFRIDPAAINGRSFEAYVRNSLMRILFELRSVPPEFHALLLQEAASHIMTRIIIHCRHTYSAMLDGRPIGAGPRRIRKVIDYIHANWHTPLDIETLCSVAGVSAKTLNSDFEKYQETTPARYVKRLRLEEARKILASDETASVMETGLKCGFSSLGHFARAYAQEFGHLPSKRRFD